MVYADDAESFAADDELGVGRAAAENEPLFFLVAVAGHVAGRAVIFIRQEFPRHGDLDAVTLGVGLAFELQVKVDRRYDAVAELLLDQRAFRAGPLTTTSS